MRQPIANRLLTIMLGCGFAILLLVIATGGPDCLEYLDWSHAAEDGDIFRISGEQLSPMGVPLTQWSHGPGMFFALPYITPGLGTIVPDGPLAPASDFRLMGWLAALSMWAALLAILRREAEGEPGLILFLAAVAFIGTHLGFYSFNHSSEILTFGCLAPIILWLSGRNPPSRSDVLGIAALAGSMALLRPHLVIYMPLLLGILAWRLRPRTLHMALVCLPTTLALAQVAWVNRWMTGSFLRSTYGFGDGGFQSLDLADPELMAVAAHPWHGLLVYHPLYALAFIVLLAGILRGSKPKRMLYLGMAVTLLAHFYIQASWYCWWLGMWSLGNRGLGVGALLLLPVLAVEMRQARPRYRMALAAGALACSMWSLLLMIQGHTNFMRWGELLAGQAAEAWRLAPWLPWSLALALVAYLMSRGRGGAEKALAASGVLIIALAMDHLGRTLAAALGGGAQGGLALLLRLGLSACGVFSCRAACGAGRLRFRPFVTAAALLLFAGTGFLFLRLAVRTETVIAAEGRMPAAPAATYQIDEVEECYGEYLLVPGFEDKKAALRRFLDRVTGSER